MIEDTFALGAIILAGLVTLNMVIETARFGVPIMKARSTPERMKPAAIILMVTLTGWLFYSGFKLL